MKRIKNRLSSNLGIVILAGVAVALLAASVVMSIVHIHPTQAKQADLGREQTAIADAVKDNKNSVVPETEKSENVQKNDETPSDTAQEEVVIDPEAEKRAEEILLRDSEKVISMTDSGSEFNEETYNTKEFTIEKKAPEIKDEESNLVPFSGSLSYGEDHACIADIQTRFMELNYMENDEATTHFGPITRDATYYFQRRNGLDETGRMTEETYNLLMSEDAKSYKILPGDSGDDVADCQDRLYEMGYLNTAPTSYFGDVTEQAVKDFQSRNNLKVTGEINMKTKEKLYSDEAEPNVWSKGDSGEALKTYQKRLAKLGYLTMDEPDGEFGSSTKLAVKRFQDRNGLIADGSLGPKTREILMSSDAIANSLSYGMKGDDIEKVQERLYKLGYIKKSSITGYYGSATEYAVRAFQKRNSLTVDGRVGKKTLALMMSDDAKKPSSSYKFYGEDSNGGGSSSGSNNGGSNNGGGSSSGGSGSGSSSPSVKKFVEAAKSRLGCRYVTGGKGPSKFDCSGLVYWCINQAGIKQSYMTSYTWRSCKKYERIKNLDDLRAGDVIVFYGHVGCIVSSEDMIDASSSAGKVIRRSFHTSWCRRNFICGYRIFD